MIRLQWPWLQRGSSVGSTADRANVMAYIGPQNPWKDWRTEPTPKVVLLTSTQQACAFVCAHVHAAHTQNTCACIYTEYEIKLKGSIRRGSHCLSMEFQLCSSWFLSLSLSFPLLFLFFMVVTTQPKLAWTCLPACLPLQCQDRGSTNTPYIYQIFV